MISICLRCDFSIAAFLEDNYVSFYVSRSNFRTYKSTINLKTKFLSNYKLTVFIFKKSYQRHDLFDLYFLEITSSLKSVTIRPKKKMKILSRNSN